MDFLDLIEILEQSRLTRSIVTYVADEIVSYKNETGTSIAATVNDETTIPDVIQICLKPSNDSIDIYIGYAKRRVYKKFNLNDITSLAMT